MHIFVNSVTYVGDTSDEEILEMESSSDTGDHGSEDSLPTGPYGWGVR